MLNAPQRHERHQLVSIIANLFPLILYSIQLEKTCFNSNIVTHMSTEHDHVQDSNIAKLQRFRTFYAFKLSDFKGLISKEDMVICEAYKLRVSSWYPLTLDIFVKILQKGSFLRLCTYHFDSMKCIIRLHLDYCRRDNALLPPTLLVRIITRPCPRMRGLGMESGARWTRRSPSVSSIGATKGLTRWLSSPTQPIERYLNKR